MLQNSSYFFNICVTWQWKELYFAHLKHAGHLKLDCFIPDINISRLMTFRLMSLWLTFWYPNEIRDTLCRHLPDLMKVVTAFLEWVNEFPFIYVYLRSEVFTTENGVFWVMTRRNVKNHQQDHMVSQTRGSHKTYKWASFIIG